MRLRRALLGTVLGLALSALVPAAGPSGTALPQSSPESVGLSTARLTNLAEFLRAKAASQAAPGYVVLVARYGKLIYSTAIGEMDVARHEPMTLSTRFR